MFMKFIENRIRGIPKEETGFTSLYILWNRPPPPNSNLWLLLPFNIENVMGTVVCKKLLEDQRPTPIRIGKSSLIKYS